MFVGFGDRGISAVTLAAGVADEAQRWMDRDVPVGPHLADQLLLPFALAGGGRFRTSSLTPHTTTNIAVIQRFLDVPIAVTEASGVVEVALG